MYTQKRAHSHEYKFLDFGESATKPQNAKTSLHEAKPQFAHKVKTQLNPFNKLVEP